MLDELGIKNNESIYEPRIFGRVCNNDSGWSRDEINAEYNDDVDIVIVFNPYMTEYFNFLLEVYENQDSFGYYGSSAMIIANGEPLFPDDDFFKESREVNCYDDADSSKYVILCFRIKLTEPQYNPYHYIRFGLKCYEEVYLDDVDESEEDDADDVESGTDDIDLFSESYFKIIIIGAI